MPRRFLILQEKSQEKEVKSTLKRVFIGRHVSDAFFRQESFPEVYIVVRPSLMTFLHKKKI